jgi:hypothetical protein
VISQTEIAEAVIQKAVEALQNALNELAKLREQLSRLPPEAKEDPYAKAIPEEAWKPYARGGGRGIPADMKGAEKLRADLKASPTREIRTARFRYKLWVGADGRERIARYPAGGAEG